MWFLAVWLGAHSDPREVVMAGPRTSNRIPRYSHDAVVAGYEFSTVRYAEKLEDVGVYDPSRSAFLAEAFRDGPTVVYEVRR